MGYKPFASSVLVRLLMLLAVLICMAAALTHPGYHATLIFLTLIAGLLAAEFIRFTGKTNRSLSQFLATLEAGDFSQDSLLQATNDAGFAELGLVLDKINRHFKNKLRDNERALRTLRAQVEHSPSPLLSVYQDSRIVLHNRSARKLFEPRVINHVNDLLPFGEALKVAIENVRAGDRFTVDVLTDDRELTLTLSASELSVAGQSERLISLQNIHHEMHKTQFKAWEDLIQVLTHEIINSVTPISSLASTSVNLVDTALSKSPPAAIKTDLIDIREAAATVAHRSDSLVKFVGSYRSLSHLPRPNRSLISVEQLLSRTLQLFASVFTREEIGHTLEKPTTDHRIYVDEDMIEQVLINLIQNSRQAIQKEKNKQIEVSTSLNRHGRVVIRISDSGSGVQASIAEKIFLPFFTTRQSGSGVGLAFVRQVMMAHGGSVKLESTEGRGASFSLVF